MHLEPEQTPVIVFYPVRLSVRLSELFLSLSHKHHLGVSQGRIFTFLPLHGSATYAERAKCGAGDWDRGESYWWGQNLSVQMTYSRNIALIPILACASWINSKSYSDTPFSHRGLLTVSPQGYWPLPPLMWSVLDKNFLNTSQAQCHKAIFSGTEGAGEWCPVTIAPCFPFSISVTEAGKNISYLICF